MFGVQLELAHGFPPFHEVRAQHLVEIFDGAAGDLEALAIHPGARFRLVQNPVQRSIQAHDDFRCRAGGCKQPEPFAHIDAIEASLDQGRHLG